MSFLELEYTNFERVSGSLSVAKVKKSPLAELMQNGLEQNTRQYMRGAGYSNLSFSDFYEILSPVRQSIFANVGKISDRREREEIIFLAGTSAGKLTGLSIIRYWQTSEDEYYKFKPYEEWTETSPDFKRKGLSMERIRAANAVVQERYGLPLHSATIFRPENLGYSLNQATKSVRPQKLVWEKLVREGSAEKFIEAGQERFVFSHCLKD